jgi:hypothetical protein
LSPTIKAYSRPIARIPLGRSTPIAESDRTTRPRLDEFERDELSNALKVMLVIGHENTSSLAAGQCEEDIVRERLRDTRDFQPLLASHFRKDVTGLLPRVCRWRNRPIGSLEHLDNLLLQRPAVFRTSDAGAQLLRDNHTEILEWSESSMKLLERFVGGAIAKTLNEELRIENVLAGLRSHCSGSGDAI